MPSTANGYGDIGDDVVLTGLSGRLPESGCIEEFAQQLFAGVDLVTENDRRWTPGSLGLPKRTGNLKDLTHFDATFFGVSAKQAQRMDPQQRIVLEVAYESIVDAGLNPAELRGSRTGVYVGVSSAECDQEWTQDVDKINGYELAGWARSMYANRISFKFDLKGPSICIDSSCSSSMFGLFQAVNAIRDGYCDAAIVAGTNLCIKPSTSLILHRQQVLSVEGRCAAFDAKASGYARSEAIVAVLLQRRRDARRLYCTVRGAGVNNDGNKPQGITYPSGDSQRRLAQETFENARLRPQDVVYVEAHGTGTKAGDPEEVNAIAELFCKNRHKPLLLGSVKSNMGHSEPVSGLCAISKVVLAMERGVIPGNLHFQTPNPYIPALRDGRIKVVDKNTPWDGGLVAVNSFGLGGVNAHVILESRGGARPPSAEYPVPRLVLASGRTDEAVERLLKLAAEHPRDAELHALLDAVHAQAIPAHPYRGYTILNPSHGEPPVTEVLESEGRLCPIWFVFGGMGSQNPGVGQTLMCLPVFATSIERSAAALKPYGVDLINLITKAPDNAFADVINSFVSIAAVQVALVDVLRELGIRPDGIIGTSFGEIGCAYADETLTQEQVMLCAYWRGRSIVDSELVPGAMASIGLPWEEAKRYCSPDIECATYNLTDNILISGPTASIDKVISELSGKGVFAQRVKSCGVAFHSKLVVPAAGKLLANLLQVIPEPKPRSARWLSSSILEEQWGSKMAKLSDAAYHVNNLLSPVQFASVVAHVPAHALVVELAPDARMQAVLRRARPRAAHVPLLRRDAPDALTHLLRAVGKAYAAGVQPQVSRLYPSVSWPVSRGTPSLASHIVWDHSNEWDVADLKNASRPGENIIEFDLDKPADAFIAGHNIDGRILFPATGYLGIVWHTIAKVNNLKMEEAAVVFENVQFRRTTIVPRDGPLRLAVTLLYGTGEFEVCKGETVVATGTARLVDDAAAERQPASTLLDLDQEDQPALDFDDIYKHLRIRGLNYRGVFRGIVSSDARGTRGLVKWQGNWISFMDSILQFVYISDDNHELCLPTRLQRAIIVPTNQPGSGLLPVTFNRSTGIISAGGVEFCGFKRSLVPRRTAAQAPPKLEKYVFVPLDDAQITSCSKRHALTAALQLAMENCGVLQLKLTEPAFRRPVDALLLPHAVQVLEVEPQVRLEATLAAGTKTSQYAAVMDPLGIKVTDKGVWSLEGDNHVVLGVDVLVGHGADTLSALVDASAANGLLLLEEPAGTLERPATQTLLAGAGLTLVSRAQVATREYLLLRRVASLPSTRLVVEVRDDEYSWVERLKEAMKRADTEDMRVYVWSRDVDSGVQGMSTTLRREAGGERLRLYYLPGAKHAFDPDAPQYKAQVQRDLAFNVLRGVWGTFRHLLLDDIETPEQVEHAYVNTLTRGDLSSLRWIASDLRHAAAAPHRPRSNLCRVYYAPLNFRDVMLATGKLPPDALPEDIAGQDCILGLEFSGRSSSGKRVMGMVAAKGLATTVMADEDFMWEVPKQWSLEEAATVPVAYATAYYALSVRGRIRRGDTVLVHAGAGGVGQAAIAIAIHEGCTVFTTVGTPEKRKFLCKRFPDLSEANIGNSRDCSFEQLILCRTGGRGVDFVLNSLAGDKLRASLRCLAVGGCFLEIGKLDLSADTSLGMAVLLKNTTVHGILLDALFSGDHREKAEVVRCVTEGIAAGAVRPLPTTVFAENQLEQAFRYMATGRHIGKVLIRVNAEEADNKPAPARLLPAIPRVYIHPAKSYVLVGGLGGLGLEIGDWLAVRGARTLVFNSRRGVRTGYQAWCIRRWRESGVRVLVSTLDATTAEGARTLLEEATTLAPIGGIFNLAAVLQDATLENLTPEAFEVVARPKINATRELDAASRDLAPELEHFVVFSSVSNGRGSAGQSNYGLANSAMERICERRRSEGLPALAVQFGPVADVGLISVALGDRDIDLIGTMPQRIASCLTALGKLLALPHAVASSIVLADKRRAQNKPALDIVHIIANILGIKNPDKAPQKTNLAELGMDSLMGTEITRVVERGYDVVLTARETRALTFERLRAMGDAAALRCH